MSASTNPLQALSSAISDAVAGVAPSLVGVRSGDRAFSGFVWKAGLVVTADEALADDGEIVARLPGGETKKAELVGRDASTDIALLRLETTAPPVTLVDSVPTAGAVALVVGGAAATPEAALGIVATSGGAWRSMRGGDISAQIDLSVAARKSSEGGLVVDAEGRALGMAVFGPRRRVLTIPAATINRVAAQLETHGRVPRGYLGVGLHRVRVDGGEHGLMAMSIDAGGPAAAAGIRQGDIVVAIDGAPVVGMRRLVAALGPSSVGKVVKLALRRSGAPLEVDLTIGERPAD